MLIIRDEAALVLYTGRMIRMPIPKMQQKVNKDIKKASQIN
jgi:hypothetical protein